MRISRPRSASIANREVRQEKEKVLDLDEAAVGMSEQMLDLQEAIVMVYEQKSKTGSVI